MASTRPDIVAPMPSLNRPSLDKADARRHLDEATQQGERTAREVSQSPAYRALVSVGLVAYGLVHLLVAWVGVSLALGRGKAQEADQQGALALLAQAPLGRVLLTVTAVGLAVLVVWQVIEACIGHREFDDRKRLRRRLSSAGRAIVYATLALASGRMALGGGTQGGDESKQELSHRLMSLPGGQVIVGLVGLGIVGFGISQVLRGVRGSFNDDLDRDLTGRGRWLAAAGFCAKGLVYAVVGVLFVVAAVRFDPDRAGGLDAALGAVVSAPWGPVLLGLMSLGIALYGLYCFYWARHPKRA